jgi:hypothetical protein
MRLFVFAIALRGLLEVFLLLALGFWGFHLAAPMPFRLLAAGGLPLLAAVAWALLLSPRRRLELGRVPRFLLELALFAIGGAALWRLGWHVSGGVLVAAGWGNRLLLVRLARDEAVRRALEI